MSPTLRLPVRLLAVRPAPVSRVLGSRFASGSAVHNLDPKKLETEKKRNLQGKQDTSAPHKEHAPGWNEQLASDSEAAVKADQAAPKGGPTKELQDKTVKSESSFTEITSAQHGGTESRAESSDVKEHHGQ